MRPTPEEHTKTTNGAVVVGFDGSEHSLATLRNAADEAAVRRVGLRVVLAQASETRRKGDMGATPPLTRCSTRPARSWRHATRSSTWQPTSSMRRRPRRCSAPARGPPSSWSALGTRAGCRPWCPVRSVPGARRAPLPGAHRAVRSRWRGDNALGVDDRRRHRRLPGGDGSAALGPRRGRAPLGPGARRLRLVLSTRRLVHRRSPAGLRGHGRPHRQGCGGDRPGGSARRALRVPGQDQRNGTRPARGLRRRPVPGGRCHAQRGTKGAPWLDRSGVCAARALSGGHRPGARQSEAHSLAE